MNPPPAPANDSLAQTPDAQLVIDLPSHHEKVVDHDVPLARTASSAPVASFMSYAFEPGSRPLPPYTIRRGIGAGGFGVVYFAVSDAGKEVALKHVQRNLDVELRGVSHCLNLKHPNLVALYDICRDSHDQAWVVMEYVAGKNLRQLLDESPTGLAASEVRRWFSSIAAGIHHLHAAGVVHRDIKPGNVFDDLGVIKVGDYGLSKFISASHRGGHTASVGTFHYMAPEIGRGEYGREIDIYALGILLYELLTGQVPFDGESSHEIIIKHLTATADLSNVAQPYRNVIQRALQKDPARRYATVAEMAAALGTALASADQPAGTIPVAKPVAIPAVEEPFTATLAAAVPAHSSTHRSAAPSAVSLEVSTCPAVATWRDEPLARAVCDSVNDLKHWWSSLDRSPGAKGFLAAAAALVLIVNTRWLLPLLSLIGIVYVPYYILRQMVLHVRQQPTYAQAQRLATASGTRAAVPRPLTRSQWRTLMRNDLRAKHAAQRLAELSSSWIAATVTTLAMAITAGVIGLRRGDVDAVALAPYGWMTVVVLIGALSLLGLGKLWELDEGEGLTRRLVLAGIGAGVGAAAYSIGNFLMLPIEGPLERNIGVTTLPQSLYTAAGEPRATAWMAHFAVLFAFVRWWKPIDPLRRSRLSLWYVAVAVVAEWGLHQFLPIAQPAGMLMVGGLAISVQMAAPWINPRLVKHPNGSVEPNRPLSRSMA